MPTPHFCANRPERIAAIIAALFSVSAQASDFTIHNGQTFTTTQTLTGNDTGIVEAGGAIVLTATFDRGIESGGANSTITNAGSISTSGFYGYGIDSVGGNANITNTGSISTSGSNAWGICSTGTTASITNAGSISTSQWNGVGIASSGTTASITNTGSISTSGNHGYGISSAGDNASITTTGRITVSGSGAIGIYVEAPSGKNTTLNVSGSITATGAATQAIVGRDGNETLNLYPGAKIVGTVDLGAGTNVVNVIGVSPSTTLGVASTGGTLTVHSSGAGLPLASGNAVTIVDTSNLATAPASLGSLSSGIFQQINQQLNRAPSLPAPVQVASSGSLAGLLPDDRQPYAWGQVFGQYTRNNTNGASLAFHDQNYGVIGGREQRLGEHRAGFFGGVAQNHMETNMSSASSDGNSLFAGAYGQYVLDQWRINGSVAVGYASYRSDRLVLDNLYGTQKATANYGGWYVSPSVSVMRILDQGDGFSWRPSLAVNYTWGHLGGYTESGTTRSNLAVGGRTAEVLDTRLQLAAHQDLADRQGEIEWRGGIGRTVYGHDDVAVSWQGVGSRYAMTGTGDVTGGYVGVNTRLHYRKNLDFSADLEMFQSAGDISSVTAFAGLIYRL
ncbi:autotransporter domain-containing protein [Rhodocyclus tenuis]|uniref:Autotransporter domain-containing protein n=1 Tax=Rhodocyclus gracilis TaxID=2929842 RepID=A0ABX0WEZ5_9RHOO|nr:autotransporter outer membrane beta-barrel domain-containing protein [Rhodocyclus gracilis]NJA88303.1 autotransporter domain-containing protein [Rhodocyclus gracilis]